MKTFLNFFILILVGVIFISCGESNNVLEEPSMKRASSYLLGDINQDGQVNIADVPELIDLVLSGSDDLRGDVNRDGKVSIDDVTTLIDLILGPTESSEENDSIYYANGVQFKMITVEGGTFKMGALNTEAASYTFEKPQHDVTLSTFKIGETEVTQELWKAVMGTNPSINKESLQNPVEYVSWEDCQLFINKLNELTGLNFRLPTEAEWEYAAIGGIYTHYYIFSGSSRAADVAWFISNSNGKSQEVKQLLPNELGIYDMSGNVYEWVNDWYERYSSDSQVDPQGPESGNFKIYRGGSWHDGAANARCHFRYMREPTYRTNYHGFRIAL